MGLEKWYFFPDFWEELGAIIKSKKLHWKDVHEHIGEEHIKPRRFDAWRYGASGYKTNMRDVIRDIQEYVDSISSPKDRRAQSFIRRLDDTKKCIVPKKPPATSTTPRNIDFNKISQFVGREETLSELRDQLASKGTLALTHSLTGYGGIGKTSTAIAYAQRCGESEETNNGYPKYTALLWCQADGMSSLEQGFLELASPLGISIEVPDIEGEDSYKKNIPKVIRWLQYEAHRCWLLILDNADDLDGIYDFLAKYNFSQPKGHILYTSRHSNLDAIRVKGQIEMTPLLIKDAVNLLFELSPNSKDDQDERLAAAELAELLGCLPLALVLAAAYVKARHKSFSYYLIRFKGLGISAMRKSKPPSKDYDQTLHTVWQQNFESIDAASPAAELLRVSAFCEPDVIPIAFVIAALPDEFVNAQSIIEQIDLYDELLIPLTNYSLVAKSTEENWYSVHRLIQAIIIDNMEDHERRKYRDRYIQAVEKAFPPPTDPNDAVAKSLYSQAERCAKILSDELLIDKSHYVFLCSLGHFIRRTRRDDVTVEHLFERAQEIETEYAKAGHPNEAMSLERMAELRENQSKWTEALDLYKQVLAIRKTSLTSNDYRLGVSYGAIARVLRTLGRYEKAEQNYINAIEAFNASGMEPLSKAWNIHGLGELYLQRGQAAKLDNDDIQATEHFTKAEQLMIEGYQIREAEGNPNNNNAVWSQYGLGQVYMEMNKLDEALAQMEKAWKYWERERKPDHPHRGTAHNGFAALYLFRGKPEIAQEHVTTALDILDHIPSPRSIYLVDSLFIQAQIHKHRSEFEEALQIGRRALALAEEVYMEIDPDNTSGPKIAHPRIREISQFCQMISKTGSTLVDEAPSP